MGGMIPAITISPESVTDSVGRANISTAKHRHPKHRDTPKPFIVTVLPQCSFCSRDAVFSFRAYTTPGLWAYGCPEHYMQWRISPSIGAYQRLQLEPRLPAGSEPTAMQEALLLKSKPIPLRDDSGKHDPDSDHRVDVFDADIDPAAQPPCSPSDWCD